MESKGPDAFSFTSSFKSGDKLFIGSFDPLVKRILLKMASQLWAMASDLVRARLVPKIFTSKFMPIFFDTCMEY